MAVKLSSHKFIIQDSKYWWINFHKQSQVCCLPSVHIQKSHVLCVYIYTWLLEITQRHFVSGNVNILKWKRRQTWNRSVAVYFNWAYEQFSAEWPEVSAVMSVTSRSRYQGSGGHRLVWIVVMSLATNSVCFALNNQNYRLEKDLLRNYSRTVRPVQNLNTIINVSITFVVFSIFHVSLIFVSTLKISTIHLIINI